MTRTIALFIGVVLCSALAHAQTPTIAPGAPVPGLPGTRPQLPPRDNSAVPAGTARIRGRVVSADTGTPLRRATVRVAANELRINRSVNTDADGRYEIADLPAGRYNIFVTRNGYVSLQFGQRRPFESGRPLDVGQAQTVEKIDFALPRGGVIAGRITDELGEPMAGVRMRAMRYHYQPNGQRQLAPAGSFGVATNDLGEFRLYGLMPGGYIVSANPSDAIVVVPGGAAALESEGHGPTFYPGTVSPDMAQAVTVGIGEEANASFAMVASRMTKVTGIVRNSQGQPISNAMISIRSRSGEGFFGRGLPVGADGRFTFSNIPPGEHWLEVNPRSSDDEVASVAITAGDRDITDLVITTSPGAVISGHVIFDSAAESGRPGRIMVYPPDPGSGPIVFRQFDNTQGTIDSNGRFQMKGVTGRVIFAIGPGGFGLPPSGWSVKKVTVNGQDFTDIPLDMSTTGSIDDVEVVLTDKQTTLSGTVRGAGGAPVTDYTVAIFPERLREGAVPGRYIRVVRPDQQGRFETKGLPPGDYFAAAVESLDQGGQWDPAFRRQVEPAAKRLRLTEGLTSTIELQLIQ